MMPNILQKILGTAAKFVPGASPASWWRPALIAFFALAWTVTQVVFPTLGLEQIVLGEWFYMAWLASAGVYGALRTAEKASGKSPEDEGIQKTVRRLERNVELLMKRETGEIKGEIQKMQKEMDGKVRIKPEVAKELAQTREPPESQLYDPDGSGGPKAPFMLPGALGPQSLRTGSEPSTSSRKQ